jgi:type 1 glutamine amidotransferase
MRLNRRQSMLAAGAAVLAPGLFKRSGASPAQGATKKVLYFTKSSGFQHSVIDRKGGDLAFSEKILMDIGKPRGYEVVCSKDGRMFDPDKIGQWDAFVFYTTGDLTKEGTDKQPPISAEGEKALYEAVRSGKGFMGMHCATDTFAHHRGKGADDPYTQMIGGEFSGHGSQMFATVNVADGKFPGLSKYKLEAFRIQDEWYGQKNLADDIHVVTYMVTDSMNKEGGNKQYDRPNFPQTWTRQHGNGRVFYTSMGHREDVWETPLYQDLLLGALDFITGKAEGSTEANISKVTPGYKQMTNDKA